MGPHAHVPDHGQPHPHTHPPHTHNHTHSGVGVPPSGALRTHADRRALLAGLTAASLLAACGPDGSSGAPAAKSAGTAVPLANVEKPQLTIGFIPITCATPIIMADPLGFYKNHGLDVTVKKYGGWADIRDAFIAGEVDAAHLLSPMPLSLSLGLGSAVVPTRLAAIENVNGQAITLATKFKDKVKGPADLKGLRLAVPFDYSMHNLLLRYYLAEGGLDPNKDVQIRVMRPPDMVANLASDNIDGYLGPDPFNQRAVFEGVGYIHLLSKELWDKHPCCAFAAKQEFVDKYPRTYEAVLRAIVDATAFSSNPQNRKKIAEAIAPSNYLNQPVEVLEAVLTGSFDDGRGTKRTDPARIDFDPYPWKSFGVWMLAQLARWGYVPKEQDTPAAYKKAVDEIFRTGDVREAQKALKLTATIEDYKLETIMGQPFDARKLIG